MQQRPCEGMGALESVALMKRSYQLSRNGNTIEA
jgi:hypothetical protein